MISDDGPGLPDGPGHEGHGLRAQLAARARVSRQWISEFEAGKPTAELRPALQLLEALGLRVTLDDRDGTRDARPGPASAVDLDALLEDYRER